MAPYLWPTYSAAHIIWVHWERPTSRTQTELACTLAAARAQTDALFQLVRPDSFYQRPIPERHRMVSISDTWRRSTGT